MHERRVVSMDLVEINEDFNKNEAKRAKYRGEEELTEVTRTVGMGIDLMTSLLSRSL